MQHLSLAKIQNVFEMNSMRMVLWHCCYSTRLASQSFGEGQLAFIGNNLPTRRPYFRFALLPAHDPMLANTFEPSLRRCLRFLIPHAQASAIG